MGVNSKTESWLEIQLQSYANGERVERTRVSGTDPEQL